MPDAAPVMRMDLFLRVMRVLQVESGLRLTDLAQEDADGGQERKAVIHGGHRSPLKCDTGCVKLTGALHQV